MTRSEVELLWRYTRSMADQMGLKDWWLDIIVDDEIDPGAMDFKDGDQMDIVPVATCEPVPGQKKATIIYTAELREERRSEIRSIVCHELVHCHLFPMREFVRTGMPDHLGKQSYEILMFGFDQAWEFATDAIARDWARKLPLIDWKKG
jgi:hypothetical protein